MDRNFGNHEVQAKADAATTMDIVFALPFKGLYLMTCYRMHAFSCVARTVIEHCTEIKYLPVSQTNYFLAVSHT